MDEKQRENFDRLLRALEILLAKVAEYAFSGRPEAKSDVDRHNSGTIRRLATGGRIGEVRAGVRTVTKDLRFCVPPETKLHILNLILAETGLTESDLLGDDRAKLKLQLERGKIRTASEFRLLRDHLDSLEEQEDRAGIEFVVRMLDEYTTRGAKTEKRSNPE